MSNEIFRDELTVMFDERGSGLAGRPILILHGGGGPRTVAGLAAALSETSPTFAPTHPGFGGEPRPEWFDGVDDLALTYLEFLERRDLRDVLVIGSSIGGWIAAEMAVRKSPRVTGVALINATGIAVEGSPVVNVFGMSPPEIAQLSFHDPAKFTLDPAKMSAEELAVLRGNQAALRTYSGDAAMRDPKLRRRLGYVTTPTLVLWGESDRVVPLAYGRAYAAAFGHATFETIAEAGHLPHFEQPAKVLARLREFSAVTSTSTKS